MAWVLAGAGGVLASTHQTDPTGHMSRGRDQRCHMTSARGQTSHMSRGVGQTGQTGRMTSATGLTGSLSSWDRLSEACLRTFRTGFQNEQDLEVHLQMLNFLYRYSMLEHPPLRRPCSACRPPSFWGLHSVA